jgi:hypothetical protein
LLRLELFSQLIKRKKERKDKRIIGPLPRGCISLCKLPEQAGEAACRLGSRAKAVIRYLHKSIRHRRHGIDILFLTRRRLLLSGVQGRIEGRRSLVNKL